jgi:AraC family transcriptional regulator, activator of mtrCDE
MATYQNPRVSASDLDNLMTRLEVNFVKLAECLVSPGWRLSFTAANLPAIHYNLSGTGQLTVGDAAPIPLAPHTLVIVPPNQAFHITVAGDDGNPPMSKFVGKRSQEDEESGTMLRYVAGSGEPQVMLICGYFRANYGISIDLFATLAGPIVERFEAADQVDQKLKSALAELVAQEVGMGAMTTALLKQVLVTLLRRSLGSMSVWAEQFSMLKDPQIARAFSGMVACPEGPHSIESLSQLAGLSRSAFMVRFTEIVGDSPMAVLRQLRMRQAAALLMAKTLSMDQIARGVGYASRSSFLRAFRKVYGVDPSDAWGAERDPSNTSESK